MKKIILILGFIFTSVISFSQIYTIEESSNTGYFSVNSVDYPKGHYGLKYEGDLTVDSLRTFTIYNIYNGSNLIASRHLR